jgi:hypothetical protein
MPLSLASTDGSAATPSARNLGLDELGKQRERLLPAQVASLGRDGFGYAFLDDVQVDSAGDFRQGNRGRHLARKVGIIELVRVTQAFVRHQFEVFASERVAVAGREVRERHLVRAANLGVDVVDTAGEAVRREPFGHCIGIEERAIHPLGRRPKHSVKLDTAIRHDVLAFR